MGRPRAHSPFLERFRLKIGFKNHPATPHSIPATAPFIPSSLNIYFLANFFF